MASGKNGGFQNAGYMGGGQQPYMGNARPGGSASKRSNQSFRSGTFEEESARSGDGKPKPQSMFPPQKKPYRGLEAPSSPKLEYEQVVDEGDPSMPVLFSIELDSPKGKLLVVMRDRTDFRALAEKAVLSAGLSADNMAPMQDLINEYLSVQMRYQQP